MEYRLFGESHAPEIGVEIDGVPAGTRIDQDALRALLDRRAPGRSEFTSPRTEPDEVIWTAGLEDGVAIGATIRAVIRNRDVRSEDYRGFRTVPRPGHADYAAYLKDGQIPPGGGRWSGRLTAPLVVAGGIALQLLHACGVEIAAQIAAIGDVRAAAAEGDSVGGVIEVTATGFPAGIGDAGEDGLESQLAAAFFAIPAVKGVEFGDGFRLAAMRGSEANDEFIIQDGEVTLATNHCGGLLGGVSVGMPIVARLAFKPTPSIEKPQRSVDLVSGQPTVLTLRGRHDRAIVLRAAPVVEAAMALVLERELERFWKRGKTG